MQRYPKVLSTKEFSTYLGVLPIDNENQNNKTNSFGRILAIIGIGTIGFQGYHVFQYVHSKYKRQEITMSSFATYTLSAVTDLKKKYNEGKIIPENIAAALKSLVPENIVEALKSLVPQFKSLAEKRLFDLFLYLKSLPKFTSLAEKRLSNLFQTSFDEHKNNQNSLDGDREREPQPEIVLEQETSSQSEIQILPQTQKCRQKISQQGEISQKETSQQENHRTSFVGDREREPQSELVLQQEASSQSGIQTLLQTQICIQEMSEKGKTLEKEKRNVLQDITNCNANDKENKPPSH